MMQDFKIAILVNTEQIPFAHTKKVLFTGRTTKVKVHPPPLDLRLLVIQGTYFPPPLDLGGSTTKKNQEICVAYIPK